MPTLDEPLAWRLFDNDQYGEVLPLLQKLFTEETDLEQRVVIMDAIAQCHVEEGSPDEAISSYKQVLALSPNDIDTLTNIGNLLSRKGDIAGAIGHYQMSVEVGNTDREDLILLTRLYVKAARLQEARDTLDILVNHHPNDASLYEMIGFVEEQRDDYVKAGLAYKRAVDMGRDDPVLLKRMATVILKMQQFEQAKAAIRLVLEDEPDDASMIYNLAVAEFHTNDVAGAIAHLKRALYLQPNLTVAKELLRKVEPAIFPN